MKAIMYGAGNIGRGFIGSLFSQSGYEVIFIDVDDAVVTQLNRDRAYPVRVVCGADSRESVVAPVCAIHGSDVDQVAEAIAGADIMATAVGVRVLPRIAEAIARGVALRHARGAKPLNIIICENLIGADTAMREWIRPHLPEPAAAAFDRFVGLIEAAIGRMVPVQTEAMRAGNPLRVCVEPYDFLPVDRDGFRGEIPEIHNMVPFSPFDFYIRRKLFIHNCGHAMCAYLGMYMGLEYIHEAIHVPEIRILCQSAMTESATALSKRYQVDICELLNHVSDLLVRFHNSALMDTCARVGADIPRKLSANDRLIGAAALCVEFDIPPTYIAAGCAAALYAHLREEGLAQSEANARNALIALSGLADEDLMRDILALYQMLAEGKPLDALIEQCDVLYGAACGAVV